MDLELARLAAVQAAREARYWAGFVSRNGDWPEAIRAGLAAQAADRAMYRACQAAVRAELASA